MSDWTKFRDGAENFFATVVKQVAVHPEVVGAVSSGNTEAIVATILGILSQASAVHSGTVQATAPEPEHSVVADVAVSA